MNRPVINRLEERRLPLPFWYVLACFACSLLFLLFQGGKLATMLFVSVSVLCAYLALGRWSGIKKTAGIRMLANGEQDIRIEAGGTLSVKIRVQVPGVWPIPYIIVKDRIVRRNGEEQVYEGSLVLDWKRRGEMEYTTAPLRRGIYTFGSTECVTEDIFGLFQHKGVLELPHAVSVYPQTIQIKEWKQFHQMIKGMQHHATTTRALRETTQINGVREYIYGDRLSRIHWNATAKTGTWKSKEFERESLPKTVIVLDRNSRAYASKEQFELAVSIAASLFEYGSTKDLALGMLSVGSEYTYFEPKKGGLHQKSVLSHLVGVEADGFHPLLAVLQNRSKNWVPGSFIVLISPSTGTPMMQTLNWIEQHQMNPCHIWVQNGTSAFTGVNGAASGTAAELREDWVKHVLVRGFMGYGVAKLADLPSILGGGKPDV